MFEAQTTTRKWNASRERGKGRMSLGSLGRLAEAKRLHSFRDYMKSITGHHPR